MPNSTGKRDEHRGGGRGFAGMEAEKQREIARKGGRAAHEKGTAHEFDSEEARAAGRKGGEVVSQNREHMAEIGAKGGHASHSNRSANSRGQRSAQGMTTAQGETTGQDDRPAVSPVSSSSQEPMPAEAPASEPVAPRERNEESDQDL